MSFFLVQTILTMHMNYLLFTLIGNLQFVNKLRYAKEGAKDIMDRACADLPWSIRLEVDGHAIEIPEVRLPSVACHPYNFVFIHIILFWYLSYFYTYFSR